MTDVLRAGHHHAKRTQNVARLRQILDSTFVRGQKMFNDLFLFLM